jgi:hypothetical protein
MGLLYGWAGRLTAENGGFRTGQVRQVLHDADHEDLGGAGSALVVEEPPTPAAVIWPNLAIDFNGRQGRQVRTMASWPRSWADFRPL